ncbi:Oxoglutarate and iron-dependent oxygenase degradation C-term-domain-containing protein [Catenaria anguillulae PL171]|uniref:uS12 prolyl 3,4-dihydroxylase n=1 Tax=Catenaria anguillulae PL171 TaxID=765915 RepID=A0A1Y2I443_9FUNG|nr:Oxoglutarate and iron-dependent oxygenase degradation C-term-domain-containing protein [Catenaria anguillulae PL171]
MDEAALAATFAEGLLTDSTVQSLAEGYKTSGPYLHTCIKQLIQPDLLRTVRKEIVDNLHFTLKETDIYKVHQTGDLANIDGLPEDERAKLATIHRLRNALYSATFRDFVSKVTGCGPLSGTKQDMSINSYRDGCHLLNHDDVIGTRRVSYILYIPDPDPWDPKFGGGLELYPCVSRGTPDTDPTLLIPPAFNQFVMFTVQPGYSFHSVQEVIVPKDRLSISGWFHIPQPGEPGYSADGPEWAAEAGPASLAQLEDDHIQDQEFPFSALTPASASTSSSEDPLDLSDADRTYLAQFLNPDYLTGKSLEQINEAFCDGSSIQLVSFLNATLANTLRPYFVTVDEHDGLAHGKADLSHGAGVRPGWKVQGSPVKQRYMVLDSAAMGSESSSTIDGTAGKADAFIRKTLADLEAMFQSPAFARWLYQVTGAQSTQVRTRARRFRAGLDYTLATFRTGSSVLDATLALTPEHPRWEEGRVGGYECYIAPDEENNDPAVYRKAKGGDDDGALLTVPCGWNVLNLVLRDAGVMRFVKYVSGLAPGSRWDVASEYLVVDEEEEQDAQE